MLIEQLSVAGARIGNAIRLAPVILPQKLAGGLQMVRLANKEGGEGAGTENIGQLNVEEVLNGAEGAMADGGTFKDVSAKVDALGGGAYNIFYKIGIFLALFAIMACAIRLMFANTNERQDLKSKLAWIIVAAVILLGVCALLMFISSISAGLFTSVTPTT